MIWKMLYVSFLNHLYKQARKDEEMMAKIYYNRMLLGTITFDAVPEKLQAQVNEYGVADVKKGKLPVEEYEMLFKETFPEE